MPEVIIKFGSSTDKSSVFEPYKVDKYLVEKPLTNNDGSFCKWGFCSYRDKKFFLKEFLSPKYPQEDASIFEERRQRQIRECNDWFQQKQKVYRRVMESANENIIAPLDFFKFKNQFYLVTERVESNHIAIEQLHQRPLY